MHGPSAQPDGTRPPTGTALETLLARMRAGDRSAIGEFVLAYGPLIRNRFRQKIASGMRSYFDSMDLVSTVARRFDQYAAGHELRFDTVEQLFALVFKIAHASCAEKARIVSRLDRTEGPDSEFARLLAARLRRAASATGSKKAFELDDLLQRMTYQEDSDLVRLWIDNRSFAEIGRALAISESAAKQRWSRLRPTLERALVQLTED